MIDISFIFSGILIFSVLMLISIHVYGPIYDDKIYNKIIQKYYELFINGIESNTLDYESILLFYKEINKQVQNQCFNNKYNLETFIESIQLLIWKNDKGGSLTKKSNEIFNPILEKIKEENTYSNVNERERRILLSIKDSINIFPGLPNSEKSAIKHNLNNLAIAIEETQNALKKNKKINKWAIAISIAGTIGTFVFGLMQSCSN